jgi:hypothetical protein
LGLIPQIPPHINPSTEIGHREPMTTIAVVAIRHLAAKEILERGGGIGNMLSSRH